MQILVYGAGVLGSLYAARLQEAGQHVSLLARGQRLQDIREHGIVLEDVLSGQTTTTHVKVVEELRPEDQYDLAVVIMGKHQVAAIFPQLAANQLIPTVLFLHNNAAGPQAMVEVLGQGRVLLGFAGTWSPHRAFQSEPYVPVDAEMVPGPLLAAHPSKQTGGIQPGCPRKRRP
jgi:2-dehydropantoate 2-reductase